MKAKRNDKTASNADQLFVVGLDINDKPRGARFAQIDDRMVSAALDMNLSTVINPSPAFAEAAKKLPEGRLFASGKAFVPDIKQALHDELFAILRQPGDTSEAYRLERPRTEGEVRCVSPITSGLPTHWDEIDTGHMVIAQESPDYGWWEAVVIKRENDILTLRYRDPPELPLFARHVLTVALVNPGPKADKT